MRQLWEIARDVKAHWPKVNYAAVPYLDAMGQLADIKDNYYQDPGHMVVRYFLANATMWRGEDAKRVKAELNAMLKGA